MFFLLISDGYLMLIFFYFRKTQFLSGSNIYIAEDFSKKVRDKRTELRKFMKQMKKRYPTTKMTMRYDKLMIDKVGLLLIYIEINFSCQDVYTYNEVAGVVELQASSVEEGRVSPTSQPNTPHHARARIRSKSSGRKKKLEKAYSTESALNYIGDEDITRSPSPTKSPFPEISEISNDNSQINDHVNGDEELAAPADIGSNGVANG